MSNAVSLGFIEKDGQMIGVGGASENSWLGYIEPVHKNQWKIIHYPAQAALSTGFAWTKSH